MTLKHRIKSLEKEVVKDRGYPSFKINHLSAAAGHRERALFEERRAQGLLTPQEIRSRSFVGRKAPEVEEDENESETTD